MGLFSKKFGGGRREQKAAGSGSVTQIQGDGFRLKLPGEWVQTDYSEPGKWFYERENNPALATSVIMLAGLPSNGLERYMEIRLRGEEQQFPGIVLSDPTYSEQNGVRIAEYSGSGPQAGRRCASVVRFDDGLLVHLCVSGSAPAREFDSVRDLAFQSLDVSGESHQAPKLADAEGYTQIKSAEFGFRLPGEWIQQDSDTPGQWFYDRDDGALSVSVLVFDQLPLDFELERYMQIRFDTERSTVPGCVISDPVYSKREGAQIAEYDGSGPQKERRVASRVQFNGRILIQLYLESTAPAEELDRARELAFKSLEVHR